MNRKIRYVFFVLVGTAVTFSAADMGWRLLLSVVIHLDKRATDRTSVLVEDHRLLYFNDGNVLIFPMDSESNNRNPRRILRVPDERRWTREMPHWSQRVRTELLDDLKRLAVAQHMSVTESSDAPR